MYLRLSCLLKGQEAFYNPKTFEEAAHVYRISGRSGENERDNEAR